MKPIRILHELAKLDVGGVEVLLMNVYRNLDREKVQFDFLVHRQDGFYEKEVIALGGRIYRCAPFHPLKHTDYLRSMDDFFRLHPEYKILHAHSDLNMWPLRSAQRNRVPVRIAHSHNVKTNVNLKLFFMFYQKLWTKQYATHKFACSMEAARWAYNKNVKPEEVRIIKNAIPISQFTPDEAVRNEYRKKLNLEGHLVVGHVGRFVPQKNHMFLIDILDKLRAVRADAVLVLVGEGPLTGQVRAEIKKRGLEKHVLLLGLRGDVNRIMQAFDVFVFPSIFEGLGIAVIEAQAARLATICSDQVPREAKLTELVQYISLKKTAGEWADAVCRAAAQKSSGPPGDVHDAIRAAGYDISHMAMELQDFYLEQWGDEYG